MKLKNVSKSLIIMIMLALHCSCIIAQDNKIVIGETAKIFSKILNEERTLQISKPAGYESSNIAYPVLFVLDGQTNYKFTAGIAGYLTAYGMMPGAIVVGINNTNRNRDMIPKLPSGGNKGGAPVELRSGEADNFVKFLQDEAIPYIERNYRTLPYKVIIGHSLGGLLVIHNLVKNSSLFSGYIAISPSLWWNNWYYFDAVQQFYKSQKSLKKYIFVTLADESEKEPEKYTQLKDAFEKNKPADLTAETKFYMDKNHITTAVEATLDGLFKIFAAWALPHEMVMSGDVSAIKDYYKKLSEQLGFSCLPTESSINQAAYMKLNSGEVDKAILLFLYNTELYPGSSNAFDGLADAYNKAGKKELAIKNYEKALKINPENKSSFEALNKLKEN